MKNLELFLVYNQKIIIALVNVMFFTIGISFVIINFFSDKDTASFEAFFFAVLKTFSQTKTYILMCVEFIGKFLIFTVTTQKRYLRAFLNAIPIYGFLHSTLWYIIKPRIN
jgi:hypothetical protein